jgi:hypothetical protein
MMVYLVLPHSLVTNRSTTYAQLARLLKQQDMFVAKRLVASLNASTAVVAAASANVTKPRISNESTAGTGPGNGGARVISTLVRIAQSATVGAAGAANAAWIGNHPTAHLRTTNDLSGNGRSTTGPLLG